MNYPATLNYTIRSVGSTTRKITMPEITITEEWSEARVRAWAKMSPTSEWSDKELKWIEACRKWVAETDRENKTLDRVNALEHYVEQFQSEIAELREENRVRRMAEKIMKEGRRR